MIDDCSPDSSIDFARSFINNYVGSISFVILKHENNKGLSAARNTGILSAKGDYLFFVDSDDYLVPGSIEKMLKVLASFPDTDIIDASFYHCGNGNTYPHVTDLICFTNRDVILESFYTGHLSLCAWNKLLKRKFIIDNELFFVDGILFEDIQWSNRLFHVVSSMLVLPDVTYVYEYNPSSTMNSTHVNATKSIRSFVCIFKDLLNTSESIVYVDHKIFIFHYILNAMDIMKKGFVEEQDQHDLIRIKRKLFFRVLFDGRLVLACLFLLMFKPFHNLLNISFIRHHIHEVERITSLLGKQFDFLHKTKLK